MASPCRSENLQCERFRGINQGLARTPGPDRELCRLSSFVDNCQDLAFNFSGKIRHSRQTRGFHG